MLEAEEAPFDLEADCAAMKEAMEGWGTDETTLTTMICSKTSKQMEDVNAKFKELYDRDLLEWVKSETSGYYKDTLVGCIRHPMKQLAHSVRDCMAGWGTDDEGLITCLVHLEDFKKAALIREYKAEFGRDIFADIEADTSGDYQKALCDLVKPAPQVWAESLTGAMKGMGTADALLINFIVLAKDEMQEVRKHFYQQNGELLEDWIESETTGDYMKTLLMLAGRKSEETLSIAPVYWAQRCRDALFNVDTLKELLVSMPATAIKRHTQLYEKVYGKSLKDEVEKKSNEKGTFFFFTNWWKHAMTSLLHMPVELYVKGLWDAMHGWGTDEYTLTGLVCTLPENMYDEIHGLYQKTYERKLVNHIESETSFNYKKVLKFQAMPWPESRATALHGAIWI
ncbi:ANXA6 [Symbiodinium pilosum]|uniref:ANXA6 protein n=1 Tax=Symbiodinium pilosum TaxID=2952 RepID=A0A812UZR3_SYMPI|nr:ANXA6 [Symbiodinium pilosum]